MIMILVSLIKQKKIQKNYSGERLSHRRENESDYDET